MLAGDGGFALIDQSATDTTNVTMYHTFFNGTNNFIAGLGNIYVSEALHVARLSPMRQASGIRTSL